MEIVESLEMVAIVEIVKILKMVAVVEMVETLEIVCNSGEDYNRRKTFSIVAKAKMVGTVEKVEMVETGEMVPLLEVVANDSEDCSGGPVCCSCPPGAELNHLTLK